MQRKQNVLISLFLAVFFCLCGFVGCGKAGKTKSVLLESITETMVVMKVVEAEKNATALSALTKLKEDGLIDFEAKESTYGAYIVSVNGKSEYSSGNSGYSWMLYTSDTEYASTEFGSVEYGGKVYGQAALGTSSLVVKEGNYYIWAYQGWEY